MVVPFHDALYDVHHIRTKSISRACGYARSESPPLMRDGRVTSFNSPPHVKLRIGLWHMA